MKMANGTHTLSRSIDDSLFHWPSDDPHLMASQCKDCDAVEFPQQNECPACSGSNTNVIRLKSSGRLWSWTVQELHPPSPPFVHNAEDFTPFLLGYVELDGQIRIEARLFLDQEEVHIGMPLELEFQPLTIDDQGATVMTYGFTQPF